MAKRIVLKHLKKEIDDKYKGWIEGYSSELPPVTRRKVKENISQVRNYVEVFMDEKETYEEIICEMISGQKFIMKYPKYFKYDKKRK